MADRSAIGWTDATWNPTTGCDRVSTGCDHCYALTMAKRLKAMGDPKYQTDGDPRTSGPGFGVATHPDALDLPLRWARPRRVFVNSMSDLFHDDVPDRFVADVFAVMCAARWHTFQVLTKRHARMRSLLADPGFLVLVRGDADTLDPWPPPNVWLGVSVEDQRWADIRIPALLGTPAAVRWVSAEPLLGPVDIRAHWLRPTFPGPSVSWVVAGGESGPGARPAHPDWFRALRDQCAAAGVPYHHKQWGAWAPVTDQPRDGDVWVDEDGAGTLRWQSDDGRGRTGGREWRRGPMALMRRVGKTAAGRELDGQVHDAYPGVGPE